MAGLWAVRRNRRRRSVAFERIDFCPDAGDNHHNCIVLLLVCAFHRMLNSRCSRSAVFKDHSSSSPSSALPTVFVAMAFIGVAIMKARATGTLIMQSDTSLVGLVPVCLVTSKFHVHSISSRCLLTRHRVLWLWLWSVNRLSSYKVAAAATIGKASRETAKVRIVILSTPVHRGLCKTLAFTTRNMSYIQIIRNFNEGINLNFEICPPPRMSPNRSSYQDHLPFIFYDCKQEGSTFGFTLGAVCYCPFGMPQRGDVRARVVLKCTINKYGLQMNLRSQAAA